VPGFEINGLKREEFIAAKKDVLLVYARAL